MNTQSLKTDKLEADLAFWSHSFNITQKAFEALLAILQIFFPDMKKSPKTIMQSEFNKKEVCESSYYYFGIKEGIVDKLKHLVNSNITENQVILLQFKIDGLPSFKSSNVQFWPILGLIEQFEGLVQINRDPFTIAIYCGNSKPTSINAYLRNFVNEIVELQSASIIYNKICYKIKISALICDTPALAFIKCIKGHGAFYGCDKCEQHGIYAGRVTFPETSTVLRTDLSFLEMKNKVDHFGPSPLNNNFFGMTSQIPADYMHMVCLGVMRKMVFLWLKGPLATRIGPHGVQDLSNKLMDMRPYIPSELARKPQSFHEFEQWKAAEFRQLLLYTGMVCFNGIFPAQFCNNFMLLSVAMTILLSKDLCHNYADIVYYYCL